MAYDVDQLRQQYTLDPYGMDINYGLDPTYDPYVDPYVNDQYGSPAQIFNPFLQGSRPQPPSTYRPPMPGPTFGQGMGGTMDPRMPRVGQYNPINADEYMKIINQLYTPEYASRDRFNRLIDAYPQREEPGWARKLVAGGMGLDARNKQGGDPIRTMEGVMYAPHIRNVADWKEKTQPTYQAAQLENQANISERTLATNAGTGIINAQRYADQARAADERNAIAASRARTYARAQEWKEMYPDYKWDTTGPTYTLLGPGGEVIQTGIKTGELSREEELLLINKGRKEAAQTSAAGAMDRANVAGQGLIVVGGVVHRYNPATQQYEPVQGLPPGEATRVGTPRASDTENKAERLERERRTIKNYYDSHPDDRKWFTYDARTDTWTMKPRPSRETARTGWFEGAEAIQSRVAEDIAHWDRVKKAIDPGYVPAPSTPSQQPTQAPKQQPQQPQQQQQKPNPIPQVLAPSVDRGTPNTPYVETSQGNPNLKRRTIDGGRTWQYSENGGNTWGPPRPAGTR